MMKSERATVEEPSHSGGKSIQKILDNKSIRRTTTMTVGLLSTIWMIDMIDRVMIGLALPMIGDEFSLSNTQLGGVVSIFAIFYMLGQVPGGMLADRFGPRPLLIVALILWSVFTALTGFAWGLVSLMVMRAMFGLSQGLFPAASFKALAERTRPKTRATAMGFMIGANNLGPGIAPLIIAP
ncbi:MFS transporter, partial [Streptomyces sp. NPDC018347]